MANADVDLVMGGFDEDEGRGEESESEEESASRIYLASTEVQNSLSAGGTINPALLFGVDGAGAGIGDGGVRNDGDSTDESEDGEEDGEEEGEKDVEEEEDAMEEEVQVKAEEPAEKQGAVYAVREAPRLKTLPAAVRRSDAKGVVRNGSGRSDEEPMFERRRTRSSSRKIASENEDEEARINYASGEDGSNDLRSPVRRLPAGASARAVAVAVTAPSSERARAKTGVVTRSSSRASSATGTSASSADRDEEEQLSAAAVRKAVSAPAAASDAISASASVSEDIQTQIPADISAESKPTHSRSKRLAAVYIPPKPQNVTFPYSSLQSGLVFDRRMQHHTELPLAKLDDDFHPEDPKRILEIYDELVAAGLVWDREGAEMPSVEQMWEITARKATREEICLVHSEGHYEWCRMLRSKSEEVLVDLGAALDSVYLHPQTFMAAQVAAGGAIEACKAVVTEQVKNSVAVIRPPGHHAEHAKPGGFCFFNNVCVAARVCQRNFPDQCRKVLILDWDVHHGNGVQEAFYDDPNVLYISLHVYNNGNFYPNGPYGDHLHCGEGLGLGKNVNIPWATHGMGDGDYMYAFQQVVMPIALEFSPDLVIISAGFDAAEGDMLGRCHVSPAGFAHMTHMLMSLAQGKVTACLEGGYNLRSIAKSALAMTRVLMGEPPDRLDEGDEPSTLGVKTVQMVMRQQANFWKCMYPKPIVNGGNVGVAGERIGLRENVPSERMHDVVRAWQGKVLWDEHQMLSLFIRREKISKSFENQVLATPNYSDARPLLVIFHDPPEVKGVPDPRTNRLELHNTWLTDATKKYVDWAVKNHFAVMDINIPRHITDLEDTCEYMEGEAQNVRANLTRELATYLWENYIELGDATHLFLLGIGDAYAGIISLLSNIESCADRVTFIVSFVAENSLQSVRRPADEYIAQWYYDHSLVFVAGNHGVWDPERSRKPRRKYGRLIKSPFDNLNDMLSQHKEQVTKVLFEQIQDWLEQHRAELAKAAKTNASASATAMDEYTSSGSGGDSGSGGNGRTNKRLREATSQLRPSPRNLQHYHQQGMQLFEQSQNQSQNARLRSSPVASSRSLPASPPLKRTIASASTLSSALTTNAAVSNHQDSSTSHTVTTSVNQSQSSHLNEYESVKKESNRSIKTSEVNDGDSRNVDVRSKAFLSMSSFGGYLTAPNTSSPSRTPTSSRRVK